MKLAKHCFTSATVTYMIETLHDAHLILHLLIQDAVLNEMALLQLFGRIRATVILGGDHVDDGKGALADLANLVILARASPLCNLALLRLRSRGGHLGPNLLLLSLAARSRERPARRSKQVHAGRRVLVLVGDGVVHGQAMASKVLCHLVLVCLLVVFVSAGDAHPKGQVADLVVQENVDQRAGAEDPTRARGGRLRVAGVGRGPSTAGGGAGEELAVDKGAIGGLVLNHDVAKVVDVDAKVNVGDAAEGVIDKDDVAAAGVAAKGEAGGGVLDLVGEAEDDGVVAVAVGVGLEAAGVVLEVVVGLDVVGLVSAENVGALLLGEVLDLLARRVGVRVEDADDVGDVFV